MTREEALDWIRDVEGQLLRNKKQPEGPEAWVAIVRTPAGSRIKAKLILCFGHTAEDAARGAEEQWRANWNQISPLH